MQLSVPGEATSVFGPTIETAARYAELLATEGVTRGVIGPREADRIWDRHLVNCAVVADAVPLSAHVVDVGSGAGLPGLVWAIRRPDLTATLLEPLQRRVDFLDEVVRQLGLGDRVTVLRGRAEDPVVRDQVGAVEWVTARAVAPLDRLVGWCLPLLRPGGALIAIKGASAAEEVSRLGPAVAEMGGVAIEVTRYGEGVISEPATAIIVRRGTQAAPRGQTLKGQKGQR
jgi:16S rRNA (guanine527-N7)-methyltransferase